MPEWLLPWLFPVVLTAAVILIAISASGAIDVAVVCCVAFPVMRVRSLKKHPPEPELVRKPFWKF